MSEKNRSVIIYNMGIHIKTSFESICFGLEVTLITILFMSTSLSENNPLGPGILFVYLAWVMLAVAFLINMASIVKVLLIQDRVANYNYWLVLANITFPIVT